MVLSRYPHRDASPIRRHHPPAYERNHGRGRGGPKIVERLSADLIRRFATAALQIDVEAAERNPWGRPPHTESVGLVLG